MELVKTQSSMPEPKKGWHIWALNKQNQLIGLGEYPRLTMGEKLMKKYKEFHQIDCTGQEASFQCDARSASGELYFKVYFEIVFKVRADRADELISIQEPLKRFVEKDIIRETQEVSEGFHAEANRAFQERLKSFMDPRRGGGVMSGPIELVQVTLRAHAPDEIQARDEIDVLLENLPGRIAVAEVRGKTDEANRLRKGQAALMEADQIRRDNTLSAAEQAQMLETIIRGAEENADPGSSYVKALRMEQESMLSVNGANGNRAMGNGDAKKSISKDEDEDPDDGN